MRGIWVFLLAVSVAHAADFAEHAGMKVKLPAGWAKGEATDETLKVKSDAAQANVLVRKVPKADASSPLAFLREYSKRVAQAKESDQALEEPASVRLGTREGASAVLVFARRDGTHSFQLMYVFPSKNEGIYLALVCSAPKEKFAACRKSMEEIAASLSEE